MGRELESQLDCVALGHHAVLTAHSRSSFPCHGRALDVMIPCVPRPETLEKKSTADRRGRIRRLEEEGYVNQRSGNGVTNDKELYTP